MDIYEAIAKSLVEEIIREYPDHVLEVIKIHQWAILIRGSGYGLWQMSLTVHNTGVQVYYRSSNQNRELYNGVRSSTINYAAPDMVDQIIDAIRGWTTQ